MYVRGRIDFLVDFLSNFGLNMLWKDEKVFKNIVGLKYIYFIC